MSQKLLGLSLLVGLWVALSALAGCGGEPDGIAGDFRSDGGSSGFGAADVAGGAAGAADDSDDWSGADTGFEDPPEPAGGAGGAPSEGSEPPASGAEAGAAGQGASGDPAPEVEPPSSGETSGATPSCPTGGAPQGPFTRRFDVATLQCNPSGACTGGEDKCLCKPDFDALAALPGHFLAVSSDKNKATTWGSGNVQAVYVDDLNTDWKLGGIQRADTLVTATKKKFPCGVPKWFIMNEISNSQWKSSVDYRKFVVDFAKRMKGAHGKAVVLAAPFQTVSKNAESWTELQKYAYVGIEAYLSGQEIKDQGFSVAWCEAQYAASVASYVKQGVPKTRLFLLEHFGNTGTVLDSGVTVRWGRQAVSAADWHKAIQVRSKAAAKIGFAGFVSYDWGANGIHAPESDRLAFMKTYRNQTLP